MDSAQKAEIYLRFRECVERHGKPTVYFMADFAVLFLEALEEVLHSYSRKPTHIESITSEGETWRTL